MNPFENKSICFRIAEILLSYGADVNKVSTNRTLLMNFSGIAMRLDSNSLDINLSVISFLLQHGADPYLKCEVTGKMSFELANSHCESDQVKRILLDTNQVYFHPVIEDEKRRKKEELMRDPIVDTSSISVGCCSIFGFCRMS